MTPTPKLSMQKQIRKKREPNWTSGARVLCTPATVLDPGRDHVRVFDPGSCDCGWRSNCDSFRIRHKELGMVRAGSAAVSWLAHARAAGIPRSAPWVQLGRPF